MFKNIKKSVKYFIIIIGIIILFPMILYPLLSSSFVQTLLIKRITRHFSHEIQSTISVGRAEFIFFNKVSLTDVLIKDKNNDTLIFTSKITASIRNLNFKNKKFTLGQVSVTDPVVALITDSTGILNLRWYLDMLMQPVDTAKPGTTVIIHQANLRNARFYLINKDAERGATPIDFNNLRLSGINGMVEDFIVRDDSTSFSIYNLSFVESGGFTVRKMTSDFLITRNHILFSDAYINCDSSILNVSHFELRPDSTGSYGNFIDAVRLDILLEKSLVSSNDLQHFVAPIKGMNDSIYISGRVYGTVAEMRGRNISLSYRDNTILDCDFDLSGLPEIQNTYMHISVNDLKTNVSEIRSFKIPEKGNVVLPEYFDKLGTISFNGSFTGFTTDFVAYGKLNSDAGNLSLDVSLRPEETNRFKIKGLVTGTSIALGALTGESDLFGNLSMRANVDMYAYSLKEFTGQLTGIVDSVEINNYKYRNISLNGNIGELTWDGTVKISEPNIKMDLLGLFNFSGELPEFDFTLNLAKANLYKLNIVESDTTASASMLLTANFKGNNIDNLDGEIKLLNSNLTKFGTTLELYDFTVRSYIDNNQHVISLHTDYADAEIRGRFNIAGLNSSVGSTLARLVPSKYRMPLKKTDFVKEKLTLNITFKNTDKINNFFRTGILLSDKSILNVEIMSDSLVKIIWNAKKLQAWGNTFNNMSFEADLSSSDLSAMLRTTSLNFMGQSELRGFSADISTEPDQFRFNFNWDNHEAVLNRGDFTARGSFIKDPKGNSGPVLKIDIDSSEIYNRNNLWKINYSTLHIDSNFVNVDRLLISNGERYYLIDGTLSENTADSLRLEFKGINISPLNYVLSNKNEPDPIDLGLKGELNGNILLTNVYHNPLIESNLAISDFSLLQSDYGTLSLISAWNNISKVADVRAGNNFNGKKMLDIAGHYDPAGKIIDLSVTADKLPINALNPLLKVFASEIAGSATGTIRLSGETNKLVIKGAVMVDNGSIKVDYLQTKYGINDSIRFNRNNILFRNIRLTDERGNLATLSGSVNHEFFKEFYPDLTITLNNTMVLNTNAKDNEMFYGIAFGSGVTTIKSGPNSIIFDISAKTGSNTRFYMPLVTTATISDHSFITFINPDTSGMPETVPVKNIPSTVAQTGIDLNFDLEVTPDAEVQLIFDEKVGDVIKGHGYGNLNINLNRRGDLRISGDYIIEEGEYTFTLGNILNKPFKIESGGRISFNGDVDNAEIDMKAIYSLRTSLNTILAGVSDSKYNERIPVECQINLSGKLFNPTIDLDIELPSADEANRAYLRNVITSEEEMNRQFLYLLVTNSFIGASGTESAGTGMAVTTTEMLSNQLSNWLSQISQDFDIGFLYRPGSRENLNAQEVEVALSTQLLNDRVTINSNLGVRDQKGSTETTEKITGDFDIEYKITEKIRFKFFNRFNDPTTGKHDYTQGIGLFFREDFDKFSDLFRKRNKSEMKKEEEPEVTANGR
jgi:hypothetical protein